MSIIMRDGKYVETTPPEEKQSTLKEIGAKITEQRLEAEGVIEEIQQERKKEKNLPKLKEKSTKILQRTQTVLKKAVAAWPVRSDLQELFQEVNQAVAANNFSNHTKTFVKVLSVLEKVIPLWTGSFVSQLIKLQKLIRLLNEKERKRSFPKIGTATDQIKTTLTTGDIDRWLETSEKGERLVYYTGRTFDTKGYQEGKVFKYARDLCFKFVAVASTKKIYTTKGVSGSDWAIKYHNIIMLMQQKVVSQQKDKEKNIISHAIYNYIMEKL
jgi:hypothetical protein